MTLFCLTYIACCSYFTKCRCDIDLRGVLVYIYVLFCSSEEDRRCFLGLQPNMYGGSGYYKREIARDPEECQHWCAVNKNCVYVSSAHRADGSSLCHIYTEPASLRMDEKPGTMSWKKMCMTKGQSYYLDGLNMSPVSRITNHGGTHRPQ